MLNLTMLKMGSGRRGIGREGSIGTPTLHPWTHILGFDAVMKLGWSGCSLSRDY